MTLTLTSSLTAVAVNIGSSFYAQGGTSPYTYAVLDGGAGGEIDASTGQYTAPATVPTTPAQQFDTIQVTDSTTPTPLTATAQIMVGDALLLFCDVVQQGMGLDPGRVFLWDQKIFMPSDAGLYVTVAETEPTPFGNVNQPSADGTQQQQFISWRSKLEVNLISRDNSARLLRSAFLMALNSVYARQQMSANAFTIGTTPAGGVFRNMSVPDGAAIPYRYQVWIAMQYAESASSAQPYIDDFTLDPITVNS